MGKKVIDLKSLNNCFLDIFRLPFVLFGGKFVVLVDSDGTKTIRMLRKHTGVWGAWRIGMGIRFCTLLDDGKIQNRYCYVKRWYPHKLFVINYIDAEDNGIPLFNGEKW